MPWAPQIGFNMGCRAAPRVNESPTNKPPGWKFGEIRGSDLTSSVLSMEMVVPFCYFRIPVWPKTSSELNPPPCLPSNKDIMCKWKLNAGNGRPFLLVWWSCISASPVNAAFIMGTMTSIHTIEGWGLVPASLFHTILINSTTLREETTALLILPKSTSGIWRNLHCRSRHHQTQVCMLGRASTNSSHTSWTTS